MKFTTAWAKTAYENVTLKIATVVLAVVCIIQLIVILNISSKDLPVIERGCFSKTLQAKPIDPTKSEIESFLIEALALRFDSNAYLKNGFLSIEELAARDKEQLSLKQKQIDQKIVIQSIKIDGKEILINADRLLSIGKIKSALNTNLKITIEQTNRSETNPYGLILTAVSQIEDKESK